MDLADYQAEGFRLFKAFTDNEFAILYDFAVLWVRKVLLTWLDHIPLALYHDWSEAPDIDHAAIFCTENRHTAPPTYIRKILLNDTVKEFLTEVAGQWQLHDDGLGWLGFRLIRPNHGDGHPLLCKAWGPAKDVVSCWVPIIGFTPKQTITLVPGSHLREWQKAPMGGKFADEFRLAEPPGHTYNPHMRNGEAVFFHPRTLHSVDIRKGNVTGLSLEFRVNSCL